MKTTARFILSATTGLGLLAFTLFSAFTAGADAGSTALAFALLTVFGLLEIAILSYRPRRFLVRSSMARPVLVARPVRVRVPALIEVPASAYRRRAA